jgi:hypothetical protein
MAKNSKRLGNSYEREFSYELSEWITGEKNTSICWRDKASGARHTIRNQQGYQTSGSGGDIYPTDLKYEYWFAEFYIDTKNYPNINWVFGNGNNQKTNSILHQWLKTITQCPRDKMPIMPCKIRDRKTPDVILFPIDAKVNYMSVMSHHFQLHTDIEVALSKKEKMTFKSGLVVEFKVILKEEFFQLNHYQDFYENNKGYINPHNRTYNQGLKLH